MDYIISHLNLSFEKLFAMDLVIVYIFSPSIIFIPHIFIGEIFRGETSPLNFAWCLGGRVAFSIP